MKLHPLAVMVALAGSVAADTREDELLRAVRQGDLAAVRALLDAGVSANTKYRYDRTALSFAADRGHLEVARLLLERGADVDARDTFYQMTPLGAAAGKGHAEIVRLMLARSTKGVADVLRSGVAAKRAEVVDAAVATGKLSPRDLAYALEAAEKAGAAEVAERLRKAGASPPPRADFAVDAATLARYAGRYREEDGAAELTLSVADGSLQGSFGGRAFKLGAIDARRFQHLEATGVTLELQVEADRATALTVTEIGGERRFRRLEDPKP
jgi:ankyrin repeat protein